MSPLVPLLALLPSLGRPAGDLPAPLEERLRALRTAEAGETCRCMAEVLSGEVEAIDAFVERIRRRETRAVALGEIAASDQGEAQRIGDALPAGDADALFVRGLLGPYLLSHVTFEVDAALSKRMRAIAGRYEQEVESALAVVPRDSPAQRARKLELVEAWHVARLQAAGLVEDHSLYPDKDRGAAGQETVDLEVRKLWRTYQALRRELDQDLARFRRTEPEELRRALRTSEAWAAAHAACSDLLATRKGVRVKPLKQGDDEGLRFLRAMLLVDAGDPQAARLLVEGREQVPESERADAYLVALLRHLYFLGILRANDAVGPAGSAALVDELERDVVRRVNEYRMALDRSPLEIDARLVEAAREHSAEMRSEGYFSHDSPHAERATHRVRIRLTGYADPNVAECIFVGANMMNGEDVFLGWFRSSLHHRILVSSSYGQVGVGRAGSHVTANLGGGWSLQRWAGALEHMESAERTR